MKKVTPYSLAPERPADLIVSPGRPTREKYRRGPFYLKIAGLDGPRPKYDDAGKPIAPDAKA